MATFRGDLDSVDHARPVRVFSFLENRMTQQERDVDVLARTIWGEARGEGRAVRYTNTSVALAGDMDEAFFVNPDYSEPQV